MTTFRFSLSIALIVAGCGNVPPPTPANELEATILSNPKAFQSYVESREKRLLDADLKSAGFGRLETDDDDCTRYRYDRTLNIMGQTVTAQIFDCKRQLSTDIGYTFL